MKTLLIVCACALAYASPASADDAEEKPQYLQSQTDIGGVVGSGRFGHRWLTRTFLNVDDERNVFEAHYGLAWKFRPHFTFDVTGGWAYESSGAHEGHAFVLGTWKEMSFLDEKLRVKLEGLHRFHGGYTYEGFYALDYSIVGVHLFNVGREVAAGFQTGSGHGLLPFRFDMRVSFGVTDGMADRATCFFMSFDFR